MTDDATRPTVAASEGGIPFAAGDVIAERYELVEMLGAGGMGAVFEAFQLDLQRTVALKLILTTKSHLEIGRKRFEREARVAAALRHPGVVAIYDYGEHEGVLYLVMEALTGPPLREQVDAHLPLLPLDRVYAIAASIADTLAFAARQGMVHRDLKPENVLFDVQDGLERVVLVDFGLAFIEDDDAGSGRVTKEGVVSGTPPYLAPEQARGDADVGAPTDVYALGCMLYEMLTGDTPFTGDVGVLIARHLFSEPPTIHENRSPASPPVAGVVEDLVRAMLAKEAADRPTAAQVAETLRSLDGRARLRASEHHDESAKMGRAARMVSVQAPPRAPTPLAGTDAVVRVAVVGEFSREQRLALAVSGVRADVVETVEDAGKADAIFLRDESQLPAALATGKPILLEVAAASASDLRALISSGIAEVVRIPWTEGGLAKQVRRAVRSAKRSRT